MTEILILIHQDRFIVTSRLLKAKILVKNAKSSVTSGKNNATPTNRVEFSVAHTRTIFKTNQFSRLFRR